MKMSPVYRTVATLLLAMVWAVTGSAQSNQGNTGSGGNDQKVNAQLVKTGLYMFSGEGGNFLLRLSANGLILVDGKLQENSYEAHLGAVRKIVKQPIRVLILTDHCEVNVGEGSPFLQDGTGIIAQKEACKNVASGSSTARKTSPLIITYDNDYVLRLGGVEAHLMHFGNAYTSGDTVVYFPNLKAVAVGNLFASTPNPDFSAGGSLVGWGPVLAQILKLDFDVVVPASGSVVSRADLVSFKGKIDTLVSRATDLVKKGVSKDQLMSQLKTDDLGWHLTFTGEQLDGFYADLSRTEHGVAAVSDAHAPATLSQLAGWHRTDDRRSIPTTEVNQWPHEGEKHGMD